MQSTLEPRVVALETGAKIQFKDLHGRVKRIEIIMLATTGTIIILLVNIILKMS